MTDRLPADSEGAARMRALVQAVHDFLGAGSLGSARVLDLGAGEGQIAAELALRGASVLAVEGRAANAERIRALAHERGLGARVEVLEHDVRELDWPALGRFDVVVCSGLLYHLALHEAVALAQGMRAVCERLLLVDTEVAWGPVERASAGGRDYRGVRFREHAAGAGPSEREASTRASLEGEHSFWLTRASLHALLHDAGFASSWELGQPAQPRREARATVAALAGEPVRGLELGQHPDLPDPRPREPAAGRLLRARLLAARAAAQGRQLAGTLRKRGR